MILLLVAFTPLTAAVPVPVIIGVGDDLGGSADLTRDGVIVPVGTPVDLINAEFEEVLFSFEVGDGTNGPPPAAPGLPGFLPLDGRFQATITIDDTRLPIEVFLRISRGPAGGFDETEVRTLNSFAIIVFSGGELLATDPDPDPDPGNETDPDVDGTGGPGNTTAPTDRAALYLWSAIAFAAVLAILIFLFFVIRRKDDD